MLCDCYARLSPVSCGQYRYGFTLERTYPSLVPRQRFSLIIIDISFHESCEILLPVEQTNSSSHTPTPTPQPHHQTEKEEEEKEEEGKTSVLFHLIISACQTLSVSMARDSRHSVSTSREPDSIFATRDSKLHLCDKGLKTPFMQQGTQNSICATRDSKLHLCDKRPRLHLCDKGLKQTPFMRQGTETNSIYATRDTDSIFLRPGTQIPFLRQGTQTNSIKCDKGPRLQGTP